MKKFFFYCFTFILVVFFNSDLSFGKNLIVPVEKDEKFVTSVPGKNTPTNVKTNKTKQVSSTNNKNQVNKNKKNNINSTNKKIEKTIEKKEETKKSAKPEVKKDNSKTLKNNSGINPPIAVENTTEKVEKSPVIIDTIKNEAKNDVPQKLENVKNVDTIVKKEEEKSTNIPSVQAKTEEKVEEKTKEIIENKQGNVQVEKEKTEIKELTVPKEEVPVVKDETENKDQPKPRELIISNGEVIENKYVNNVDSNDISSIDLINEIEKNIISREKNSNVVDRKVEIKKGEWTTKDVIEINDSKNTEINKTGAKFKITTKENNNTKKVEELKKIAYKAYKNREYEIAIKYYKAILKIDPKDNLSKLSLATSYHALKQYRQAKPIYVELMQIYPDNENIVSNLISIIVNESPYEAVYLVPSISEKYENSAAIQAQTSMSFAKVKNYKEAIKYIKKALYLDRNNVEYLYNMGVLYDLSGDYGKALSIYRDVAANIDNNSNIKKNKLLERIQVLSNLKK